MVAEEGLGLMVKWFFLVGPIMKECLVSLRGNGRRFRVDG